MDDISLQDMKGITLLSYDLILINENVCCPFPKLRPRYRWREDSILWLNKYRIHVKKNE